MALDSWLWALDCNVHGSKFTNGAAAGEPENRERQESRA
jgi:hypothetical protein